MVRIVASVACCDPLGAQRATNDGEAQRDAQHPPQRPQALSNEPVDIHAQRIAQQGRNGHATNVTPLPEQLLRTGGAILGDEIRRSKAQAILAERQRHRIAVVAEAGNPAIIAIAVRDVAYGEIEIPAECYDPVALLTLLDKHAIANN